MQYTDNDGQTRKKKRAIHNLGLGLVIFSTVLKNEFVVCLKT
jgi:hypothetical protein